MKLSENTDSKTSELLENNLITAYEKKQKSKKIEVILEKLIFNSRWLLTPFYLCLSLIISLLFIKFFREFIELIPLAFQPGLGSDIIVATLNAIDLVLMANLLLIIVLSGYESFVSKFDIGEQVDRPEWMGKVSYSGLKIKVIGSIVTISAIELLESFINITEMNNQQLLWRVIIHMSLVISGLLFAVMDKTIEHKN